MPRTVTAFHSDPLDCIWLETLGKIGIRVQRSADTYASFDGRGTLILSEPGGMDADDCLAQMILHEICHFLVQGAESLTWVDWGLDNEGNRDDVLEHACLRVQAALLEPLGLRHVLAPTTDFRVDYDALPADPFAPRLDRNAPSFDGESIVRARAAYGRRRSRPVGSHLERALEATSSLVELVAPHAPEGSLWSLFTGRTARHPLGAALHPARTGTCGACAWSFESDSGAEVSLLCRAHDGARTERDAPGCEHYEREFDCLGCGACCREAYDTVEVDDGSVAIEKHRHLMVVRSGGLDMARRGSRCIALQGGVELLDHPPAIAPPTTERGRRVLPHIMPGGAPFTCEIYEDRPATCRDFTLGSENCLEARRAVGLSR